MKKISKIGGSAMVLFSLSFMALIALENQKTLLGFEDSDNPSVMIRFLQEHLDIFTYTGIINVALGILLVLAALAIWEIYSEDTSSLILKFGTLFAFFASAYFFSNGILRIQAPGTLLHMDNYNHDWGLAGYVSLQIIGTQGLASAGGFALAIWEISISIVNFRSNIFWVGFSWLGLIAPSGMLFSAFFGPILPNAEFIYTLYILSIFSVMLIWCLLVGINLISKKLN
jgi:hypothetical protein